MTFLFFFLNNPYWPFKGTEQQDLIAKSKEFWNLSLIMAQIIPFDFCHGEGDNDSKHVGCLKIHWYSELGLCDVIFYCLLLIFLSSFFKFHVLEEKLKFEIGLEMKETWNNAVGSWHEIYEGIIQIIFFLLQRSAWQVFLDGLKKRSGVSMVTCLQ